MKAVMVFIVYLTNKSTVLSKQRRSNHVTHFPCPLVRKKNVWKIYVTISLSLYLICLYYVDAKSDLLAYSSTNFYVFLLDLFVSN